MTDPNRPTAPAPARAAALAIRDSTPADVPAIQSIYSHHVLTGTGSFELEPPSVDEMARRRDDVLRNGFPYLVAHDGGRVLGYAYVNFYRARPAYRFSVEDSIYVAHDAVGRGVGRRLLTALVERSAAAGCRQMFAVIGDSANTGSIGLHASCGFRFAGVFRSSGWKFGRWLDTVFMQRELGEGERSAPPPGA